MEIIPSLLGFISNRLKVVKQNVSDLVNDTGNALEKTAENTAQTIKENIQDPMAFAGAGTMIGKNAKLFNLKEADRAQKMVASGRSPKEAHGNTGTWTGHPDKQLRQEISDAEAAFDPTHFLVDAQADRYIPSEMVKYTKDGTTLGQVLRHPALFANYPELKNVEALIATGSKTRTGEYNPAANRIIVSGRNPDEALSILIHEVAHAVQRKEGWAPGASMEAIPFDSRTQSMYEDKIQQLKRSSNIDWTDTVNLKNIDNKMRYELYARTAGEMDARAAQNRQYFDEGQLRQVYPELSYDIPLKEMILGHPR